MVIFHLSQLNYSKGGGELGQLDIADLVATVKKASDAVMRVYTDTTRNWEVKFKDGNSPLTLADRQANEILIEGLKKYTSPTVGIISEEDEESRVSYETRKTWSHAWVIDPLDGTKEFIKRNGEFTVNVGLQRGGLTVGGIVSVPVTGQCYVGFEGMGAWKLSMKALAEDPVVTPICCKQFHWRDHDLAIVGSRSHSNSRVDLLLRTLNQDYSMVVCGSSLKMLSVAEGKAHIYPRLSPCCEWDTCAAHAILKEAGGQIYALECIEKNGSNPSAGANQDDITPASSGLGLVKVKGELEYNKEDLLNPYFLCVGKIDLSSIPKSFA